MKIILLLILVFTSIICISQSKYSVELKDTITNIPFSFTPVNIAPLNSEFDDYNSYSGLYIARPELFIFSTNRLTQGKNFDYVSCLAYIEPNYNSYKMPSFSLKLAKDTTFSSCYLEKINTKKNEFGPYLIDFKNVYSDFGDKNTVNFFITKETHRNLDIFSASVIQNNFFSNLTFFENDFKIKPVRIINTKYNDAYLSFSKELNTIYYTSDKDKCYNIYQIQPEPPGTNIERILKGEGSFTNKKILEVCSDYDDKCPFIFENIMFFTSNRKGGYGGYDLYYSTNIDGNTWSEPKNLREKINTKYDEYRPIIMNFTDTEDRIMVFSSNRPNGKGGFDLYIVRVDKLK